MQNNILPRFDFYHWAINYFLLNQSRYLAYYSSLPFFSGETLNCTNYGLAYMKGQLDAKLSHLRSYVTFLCPTHSWEVDELNVHPVEKSKIRAWLSFKLEAHKNSTKWLCKKVLSPSVSQPVDIYWLFIFPHAFQNQEVFDTMSSWCVAGTQLYFSIMYHWAESAHCFCYKLVYEGLCICCKVLS